MQGIKVQVAVIIQLYFLTYIERKRDTVNLMEMNSNTSQEINNESYGIQATCTNSCKGKYTNGDR